MKHNLFKDEVTNHGVSLITIIYSIYFFVSPFEDLLNFGSGTILKYIALFIASLIFINLIKNKDGLHVSTPMLLIPLILIFNSWASVLWSKFPDASYNRNIAYTLLPTLFLLSSVIKLKSDNLIIIKRFIIASGICVFFYTMYNYSALIYHSNLRFVLTEGNDPNNLAAYLILPFFLILESLFKSNKTQKVISFFLLGAILFTILSTGSRGAMISMVFGYFFIIYNKYQQSDRLAIIKGLLILIAVAIITFNFLPEYITNRVFNIESFLSDFEGTQTRSSIWKSTLKNVLPNIGIIGVGSGSSPFIMIEYLGTFKAIHNTYLNMIVEYGILSLPIFLVFLTLIFKKIFNCNLYLAGSLLSMLIIIFFLDAYAKKFFWNLLIFIVLNVNIIKNTELEKTVNK